MAALRVALLLLAAIVAFTDAQSCSADSGSGSCINTSSQSCSNGILVTGYCPGPSNIVCCVTNWGSCSVNGAGGSCVVTSACSGHSVAGYCPGPSNVQCCVGGPAPPPAPSSVQAVVNFANSQWNCVTTSCSQTVPAGTAQPGYACAEFVARSLAAGGFIPLSPLAPQSSYLSYDGYDLCWVGSLYNYLIARGWTSASTAEAGSVVMGNAGDGSMSHTCIGVGSNLLDCHNNARQGMTVSWIFIDGVNYILAPPGVGRNATKALTANKVLPAKAN